MAKKRKRNKKTSKGLRPSISAWALKAVRVDVDTDTNKVEAWRAGKNPWMTVANPNQAETNKRFIRIKADRYFGSSFKDLKNKFKRDREGVEATI